MAWQIEGTTVEACSCKMVCRCTLGPAEPDQGWCSAAQVMRIEQGSSDGVDLSGAKAALAFQLPGDFFGGIDVARLYVDEGASEKQRRELEAIFTGERGGVWATMKDAMGKWLPTKVVRIEVESGEKPSFMVGDVGVGTFERLKTEAGKQAKLVDAPVMAAFEVDMVELARADGSRWSDPEMRRWESLGFGGVDYFNWSA